MERKHVYQNVYTNEDYDNVMKNLPDIINEAERKAAEVVEPTVKEKTEIMNDIKNFIKEKKRKVYGGTALNEELIAVNPADAIYDKTIFSDIEFYSPLPIQDLIELTNRLYEKGYKHVIGKEAQHEETYTIFVNFQLYCDITYVPKRVYNGIKVLNINGIHYVDPHFMLIDYLRMINQPLTAAGQRWEKAFKRMYKLLKDYPLENYNNSITISTSEKVSELISKIKTLFMMIPEVQNVCLINGFVAYNFFIKHAYNDRNVEQQSRTIIQPKELENMITNVPFIELITVNYKDTVERLFNFLKKSVKEPKKITIQEYYPLFQFTNYSVVFLYKGDIIAKVYEADGTCVPDIKTTNGYMYVSYQYLLMTLLINKFRSHLDEDKQMYFNYGIAISNLIKARNSFLAKRNISVINNTVFGEFKIACVGTAISFIRESQLRSLEKYKQGKRQFTYSPEQFFSLSPESQLKIDPTKHLFKNTSGNMIRKPINLLFRINSNDDIELNIPEKNESEKLESEKNESEKNESSSSS